MKTYGHLRDEHSQAMAQKVKTGVVRAVEPLASTIPERMAALESAHRLGLALLLYGGVQLLGMLTWWRGSS